MIFMERVSDGIFMTTAFIPVRVWMTNAAEDAGQRLMEEIKWERPNNKLAWKALQENEQQFLSICKMQW